MNLNETTGTMWRAPWCSREVMVSVISYLRVVKLNLATKKTLPFSRVNDCGEPHYTTGWNNGLFHCSVLMFHPPILDPQSSISNPQATCTFESLFPSLTLFILSFLLQPNCFVHSFISNLQSSILNPRLPRLFCHLQFNPHALLLLVVFLSTWLRIVNFLNNSWNFCVVLIILILCCLLFPPFVFNYSFYFSL